MPVQEDNVKSEDDWIEWKEGYLPPSPELLVDVKFRDGDISEGYAAGSWRWGFIGSSADIVAYRIVDETPCPSSQKLYQKDLEWWRVEKEKFEKEKADRVDTPRPYEWVRVNSLTDNLSWFGSKKTPNKYLRDYPFDTIDIYRILQVYEVTDPCIQHAVKKLLCAGQRGYKEVEKDVQEAIQSLQRWEEMRREDVSRF